MLDGTLADSPTLTKPQSVRVASPADEEGIFDLLWDGLRIDNDMGMPADQEKVRALVRSLCARETGIIGVINDPETGRIVGSIGLLLTQTWFSSQWYISEVWCFVQPKWRHGHSYGRDLFNFARWHQEDLNKTTAISSLGYPLGLEISVYSNNRLKSKERLWSRYARHIGSMFWIKG